MIAALLIGRKGSQGLPGKNLYQLYGKPLAYYPLRAARESKLVDEIFMSTDDEHLMSLAKQNHIHLILRPEELCTNEVKGEEVFVHGYQKIREKFTDVELIVLMHCNSGTVSSELIDEGIEVLRKNPQIDSATTVSKYNMWSPLRARKIDESGLLKPFVPFDVLGDPETLTCDRDSQGDVYFADMSFSIVRPKCLDEIDKGLLPQRWMGQSIYPLIQEGGCDVDYEYQIPQTEFWLKKNWKFDDLT